MVITKYLWAPRGTIFIQEIKGLTNEKQRNLVLLVTLVILVNNRNDSGLLRTTFKGTIPGV